MKKIYCLMIQTLDSYINGVDSYETSQTVLVESIEDFSIVKDFLIEKFSAYDIEYTNSTTIKPETKNSLFYIPFLRVSYDLITFKCGNDNCVAYYKEEYIYESLCE